MFYITFEGKNLVLRGVGAGYPTCDDIQEFQGSITTNGYGKFGQVGIQSSDHLRSVLRSLPTELKNGEFYFSNNVEKSTMEVRMTLRSSS
jgi:hypothetical protein